MLDLYRSTAIYIRASFPALLLVALALATLDTLGSSIAAVGAGLAVQILLIALFLSHFLYGDPPISLFNTPPKRRLGRFLIVFLMLSILPFVAAIPVAMAINLVVGQSLGMIGIGIIAPLLAIGLFGTALPASIDRDPRYNVAQGIRRLTRTLGLLVAGPGLVTLVAGICIFSFSPSLTSPKMNIIFNTATTFLGFVNSALTAALLCKVYREILSDAAPPQPA